MAKPGPRKTPKELNELRGNPGRRKATNTLDAPTGTVKCPECLNDAARAEWDRIVPILRQLKMLKPGYRAMLSIYCDAWAEFEHCVEKLKAPQSMGLVNPNGQTNKYIEIKIKASDRMNRMAAHFGLSPSAFAALDIPEEKPESEKSKFFGKNRINGDSSNN